MPRLLLVLAVIATFVLIGTTAQYLPDYVRLASPRGQREFHALQNKYEASQLTRQQMDDATQEWASRQDQNVQVAYKAYIKNRDHVWAGRFRVLSKRLVTAKGSCEAKEMLNEMLREQQWTNLTLAEFEAIEVNVEKRYPADVRDEAIIVWNSINPANWEDSDATHRDSSKCKNDKIESKSEEFSKGKGNKN